MADLGQKIEQGFWKAGRRPHPIFLGVPPGSSLTRRGILKLTGRLFSHQSKIYLSSDQLSTFKVKILARLHIFFLQKSLTYLLVVYTTTIEDKYIE